MLHLLLAYLIVFLFSCYLTHELTALERKLQNAKEQIEILESKLQNAKEEIEQKKKTLDTLVELLDSTQEKLDRESH